MGNTSTVFRFENKQNDEDSLNTNFRAQTTDKIREKKSIHSIDIIIKYVDISTF